MTPSGTIDEEWAFVDPKSAGASILNFLSPELWESISVLYKYSSLWYFVTAAQMD
jgi:hypothetical protein